ncbi:MAG TPA: methyltransferase domain-containing protein [Solirubrobacteraceae bacterium]|jgi:trans-aconitate 2-methyltransferase|nr:methyltransferase domain-containing protein [Solirubrobacteraceae bacterium]
MPDWDASTYHRVSEPHQVWARQLLDRLALRGDEVVLDAGCGSGRVTEMLIDLVPEGRVYAVDVAPSMVEHTRQLLGDRVVASRQDLTELSLPEPVDAIFSSATFHWIPDHPKLFAALAAALKPGGRIVAQCGGFGNIDSFRTIADDVAHSGEFDPYFANWSGPWNYARADLTAERLETAGFVDVQTWLEPSPATIDEPESFVRTVCLLRHLDLLPEDLQTSFIRAVLARTSTPLVLDYVRLNIVAHRAGEAR